MSPWNVPDIDGSLTNVQLSPSGSVAENFLAKKKNSAFVLQHIAWIRADVKSSLERTPWSHRPVEQSLQVGLAVGLVQWGLLRGCAMDSQLLTFKYHLIQGQPTLKYHQ